MHATKAVSLPLMLVTMLLASCSKNFGPATNAYLRAYAQASD